MGDKGQEVSEEISFAQSATVRASFYKTLTMSKKVSPKNPALRSNCQRELTGLRPQ
jgi:hypothetical protein